MEPKGPPPGFRKPRDGSAPPHDYDGQIKFYRLASSLHAASHTNGYRAVNRNVLFAISNLRSASVLLPMICEMAKWNRNYVHAAFMGREDIPISALLKINGINEEGCPAMWHDARPDYAEYSNEARAELTVSSALMHIQSFLHPQVAIMDDSISEDPFFVRGLRNKAKTLKIPIIEIPSDRGEQFTWLTRLDAGSLRSWHRPNVDILVQVPSTSSGTVIKLLKSIRDADYTGMAPPHLTIELPANADGSMEAYLRDFSWPPRSSDSPLETNSITIRRRVADRNPTQENSVIRLLELFYPTKPSDAHVLVLAPNVELSPLYYHFIKYLLLEYRYSSFGEEDSKDVMGISLERPLTLLDGKTKLTTLAPEDMHTSRYAELFASESNIPFLGQAPNSHAALYFGDKWVELHSFVRNRIAKQHQKPAAARPKTITELLPAWTEYMLELMRARGYSLLYPGAKGLGSLVTLHYELPQLPEEFSGAQTESQDQSVDVFIKTGNAPPRRRGAEDALIPQSRPLHMALPFDGDLPEVPHLPFLGPDGAIVALKNVSSSATAYSEKFREKIGGCVKVEGRHRKVVQGSAEDLFCFGDEGEDQWELDGEPPADVLDWEGADEGVAIATVEPTSTSTGTVVPAETSDRIEATGVGTDD